MCTCFPDMNSPVFPSLDHTYCTMVSPRQSQKTDSLWRTRQSFGSLHKNGLMRHVQFRPRRVRGTFRFHRLGVARLSRRFLQVHYNHPTIHLQIVQPYIAKTRGIRTTQRAAETWRGDFLLSTKEKLQKENHGVV